MAIEPAVLGALRNELADQPEWLELRLRVQRLVRRDPQHSYDAFVCGFGFGVDLVSAADEERRLDASGPFTPAVVPWRFPDSPAEVSASRSDRSQAAPGHSARCSSLSALSAPGLARLPLLRPHRRARSEPPQPDRHGLIPGAGRDPAALLLHVACFLALLGVGRPPTTRRDGSRGHRDRPRPGKDVLWSGTSQGSNLPFPNRTFRPADVVP